MNTEELRQAVNKYCEDTHKGNFDAGLDIGVSQWTLRKFRLGGEVTPRTLQKIEKFFSERKPVKWIDKIHTMTSDELTELLTEDFDHSAVCNVCLYHHKGTCCDLCQIGIKAFLESEV